MKKLFFLFGLLLTSFISLAQETPTGTLIPVNGQFYITISGGDTAIWHYKGYPYGYERLARYKDLGAISPGSPTPTNYATFFNSLGQLVEVPILTTDGATYMAVSKDIYYNAPNIYSTSKWKIVKQLNGEFGIDSTHYAQESKLYSLTNNNILGDTTGNQTAQVFAYPFAGIAGMIGTDPATGANGSVVVSNGQASLSVIGTTGAVQSILTGRAESNAPIQVRNDNNWGVAYVVHPNFANSSLMFTDRMYVDSLKNALLSNNNTWNGENDFNGTVKFYSGFFIGSTNYLTENSWGMQNFTLYTTNSGTDAHDVLFDFTGGTTGYYLRFRHNDAHLYYGPGGWTGGLEKKILMAGDVSGDLGYTAENTANKVSILDNSTTHYPSAGAVKSAISAAAGTSNLAVTDSLNKLWGSVIQDSTVNNTTALQGVINYAASQQIQLRIPAGVYSVTTIYLPSNSNIIGDQNVTIKSIGGVPINTFTYPVAIGLGARSTISNIRLENITIDGNQANISGSNIFCLHIGADYGFSEPINNVTLRNVYFKNAKDRAAVWFEGDNSSTSINTDFTFDGCRFYNNGGEAIQLRQTVKASIINCFFTKWGIVSSSNPAIALQGSLGNINTLINGCKFTNTVGVEFAIESQGSNSNVQNIVVTDNTFQDAAIGGSGISGYFNGYVVANNHFINGVGTWRSGLELNASNGVVSNNYIQNGAIVFFSGSPVANSKLIVSDNMVTTNYTNGSCVNIGGYSNAYADFHDNYFDNTASTGTAPAISLGTYGGTAGVVSNINIHHNTILAGTTQYGISFTGASGSGNIKIGNNAFGTSGYAVNIATQANWSNVEFIANDFSAVTSGAFNKTGAFTSAFRLADNKYTVNANALTYAESGVILQGTGSPNSVVTAPVGSVYTQSDGTAGKTLWTKSTGTGNTGWEAVPTPSAANAWSSTNTFPSVYVAATPFTPYVPGVLAATQANGSATVLSINNNTPYGSGLGIAAARMVFNHNSGASASSGEMAYTEGGNTLETSGTNGYWAAGVRNSNVLSEGIRINPALTINFDGYTIAGLLHTNTNSTLTSSLVQSADLASSLSLPGSPTTTTQVAADNSTKIATTAFTADVVNTATDANYTITSSTQLVKLPVITAARTVTLPTASSYTGRLIRIWNQNTSGTFLWTFASTVKDRDGTTDTAIANQTWVVLESDGTNWNWVH